MLWRLEPHGRAALAVEEPSQNDCSETDPRRVSRPSSVCAVMEAPVTEAAAMEAAAMEAVAMEAAAIVVVAMAAAM